MTSAQLTALRPLVTQQCFVIAALMKLEQPPRRTLHLSTLQTIFIDRSPTLKHRFWTSKHDLN